MADDPTRDEFPATPPTGAPFVPYQAPTRRQLRESEARAKAREAGADDPVPLVEPPLHEARPFPLDADGTLNPALNRPSAPSQHESTSPAVAASTVATAPRVNGVPIHTTTVEELFAVDPEAPWPLSAEPARKKPKKHRFVWLWVVLGLLLVAAGGAAAVWVNFEDQVREVFGWELQNDYVGSGNGEPITVTVVSGQIGSDIATTLYEAGVTMSYDAFYDLLVAQPTQPSFMPGTYQLQGEMSAQSALDVLVDPTNIVTSSFVVPEGTILPALLQRVSDGTGIPLADLQAVAADYTSLGIPADAPSAEGFLFPATYEFEPGATAQQVLQTMADRMTQSLDAAGVAPADRLRVLTFAALVQKESGSVDDMYKIARVFQNRLDTGELLRSDASIAYGTGHVDSINTTTEEQEDTTNLYNTYARPGLPVGPISAPGDDAIDAVLHPAVGAWLFFCLVNPETGETKFTNTYPEHQEAVAELAAWAKAYEERTGSPYNFNGSRGSN